MVFAVQDVVRIPPVFQHRDRICCLHRAVHIVGSHPRRTPGLCASSHRSTAETDSAAEEREFEPAVQPRERNRIAAPSCPVWETECSRAAGIYFGVPEALILFECTFFAGFRKAGMPEE